MLSSGVAGAGAAAAFCGTAHACYKCVWGWRVDKGPEGGMKKKGKTSSAPKNLNTKLCADARVHSLRCRWLVYSCAAH